MAMSLERRQQVAAEKKTLIKEAALSLFDQKGYRDTTIEDIAKLAGISKGLVYKYFSSKKEILLSFEDVIEECGVALRAQKTPLDSLRLAAGRVLLDYGKTGYHAPMRVLIDCYTQGELTNEDLSSSYAFADYGKREYGPLFKKGQEMGQIREGDPILMGDLLWHIIIGYATQMVHTENNCITEEMIDNILSLFSV